MGISNSSQVQFKLYTSSLSNFKTWIESNKSSNIGTIFFITQERTIYLDGLYYGFGTSGIQGIQSDIGDIQSDIQALETWQEQIGTQTSGLTGATNTLIQWVSALSEKFNGSSIIGQQGPSPDLDTTISIYDGQGPVNAVDAINKLAAKLNTLAGSDGAVTSVQGAAETGKFVSSIGKQGNIITVTYTQPEDTDVKFNGATSGQISITGDNVQEGFQSVAAQLNGHQTRIAAAETEISGTQSRVAALEGTVSSSIQGVQSEISSKISELKGTIPEGFTGNQTVGGAIQKALDVESTLNTLTDSGQVAQNAQKIENLIAELRDLEGESGDLVGTLIDKLEVLLQYANTRTQDGSQPGGGYYNVNGHQSNTLQGIISELEDEIADEIAALGTASAQGYQSAIEALDAEVNAGNTTTATQSTASSHIGVQVTEVDGKLTEIKTFENDIASAQQLTTVGNQAANADVNAATALTRLTWTVIGEPEPEPEP